MKTLKSQHMQATITPQHLKWAQSVDKAFDGGVDMGAPIGTDANGVYNKFTQGNSSGILIRVGAAGSSEPIQWPTSGNLNLQHGLGRQPIGFKIVDKDGSVDVYRVGAPTDKVLTVTPTSRSVNVTLYVF